MKRMLLSSPLLLGLCGCPSSSAPAGDTQRTAELADKLVACQNERSALKEQLGDARAEVVRLKAQLKTPSPEPTPRAGRASPHRSLPAHDVLTTRPTVHRHGPDNPEAEARAAQEMAQQLRASVKQFRPCYERGLKRNANLQFLSQIKVRLTVTPEGRARDVHVSPRTEADMEACIGQLVSRWQVAPYRGQPVVVELPVSLKVQQ